MNYDYWKTTSDIDYEESCNTECRGTDDGLELLSEIIEENNKKFMEGFIGYKAGN